MCPTQKINNQIFRQTFADTCRERVCVRVRHVLDTDAKGPETCLCASQPVPTGARRRKDGLVQQLFMTVEGYCFRLALEFVQWSQIQSSVALFSCGLKLLILLDVNTIVIILSPEKLHFFLLIICLFHFFCFLVIPPAYKKKRLGLLTLEQGLRLKALYVHGFLYCFGNHPFWCSFIQLKFCVQHHCLHYGFLCVYIQVCMRVLCVHLINSQLLWLLVHAAIGDYLNDVFECSFIQTTFFSTV